MEEQRFKNTKDTLEKEQKKKRTCSSRYEGLL